MARRVYLPLSERMVYRPSGKMGLFPHWNPDAGTPVDRHTDKAITFSRTSYAGGNQSFSLINSK